MQANGRNPGELHGTPGFRCARGGALAEGAAFRARTQLPFVNLPRTPPISSKLDGLRPALP